MRNSGVMDLTISDHFLVYTTLNMRKRRLKISKLLVRSQTAYDPTSFAQDVANIPWHVLSHFERVEDKLASFTSLFSDVLNQHAPVRVIKTKTKPRPFITTEIKALMHERDLAHRIARKTHNLRDWFVFRNIKRHIKLSLQRAESDFVRNEIQMQRTILIACGKLSDAVYQFETH